MKHLGIKSNNKDVAEQEDLTSGSASFVQTETFEESGALSTAVASGFQWGVGNGDEIGQNGGVPSAFSGTIRKIFLHIFEGSATIALYINGVNTGNTISASGTNSTSVVNLTTPISEGDRINFRTTSTTGNTNGGQVGFLSMASDAPSGFSINDAIDVDISGIQDGQGLVWDSSSGKFIVGSPGGTDESAVGAIAAGSTLGLQQELLALQGQVGKTVLAVGHTYYQGNAAPSLDHKAQITSLEDGNVIFVYANGSDFNNNIIQEGPIFLSKGEVYVIQNIQNGSIITATEGAYGYSQQRNNNDESPMPLLSLALSFTDSFVYCFRNSNNGEGKIWIVNGPIKSSVTIKTGTGADVLAQNNIEIDPWEHLTLNTNGNGEYRITSTNKIMACVAAEMDTNRFYDSRLILPVSSDAITWPRSGFLSSPYSGTIVKHYVNDNTSNGTVGQNTLNPGTPVDYDGTSGSGANDADYEPRGATRTKAAGLFTAFSGADSAGLEASPTCPVSTFTQRIALPLHIRQNGGDGGNNGIALASCFVGIAKLYEWDPVAGVSQLVTVNDPSGNPTTEIRLIRRNGSVEFNASTRDHQNYPASALISPQGSGGTDPGAYDFLSDFNGGYIEIDVPCTCVFNSEQNENGATDHVYRGTSGQSVSGIHSDDDEQLSYGITPTYIKSVIREGQDGLLYKSIINSGVESFLIA